jgi:hypothetical protein
MNLYTTDLIKYVTDNVHVPTYPTATNPNYPDDTGSFFDETLTLGERTTLAWLYDNLSLYLTPTLFEMSAYRMLDFFSPMEDFVLDFKPRSNFGNFGHCGLDRDTNFVPFFKSMMPRIRCEEIWLRNMIVPYQPIYGRTFIIMPVVPADHGFEDEYELAIYNDYERIFDYPMPYRFIKTYNERPNDHVLNRYKIRRKCEPGVAEVELNYKYLYGSIGRVLADFAEFEYIGACIFLTNVANLKMLKMILRMFKRQRCFRNILLSGDIEANPGPVLSTLRTSMRNNNPNILATRMKAQIFDNATNSLNKISSALETTLPVLMEFIEGRQNNFHVKVDNNVRETERIITNNVKEAERIITKACNIGENISSDLIKAILVSSMCLALCCMSHHKTALALAIISLFKLYKLPQPAIDFCKREFERMRAQVLTSSIVSVGKVLLTGLSCLLLNRMPDEKNFLKLTKKISGMGHALKGVKEIFSSITTLWEVFREQLEDMIWQDSPVSFKSLKKRITIWSDKIIKYSECNEMDKLIGDMATSNDVQRLYQEGLSLKQEVFALRDKDLILHVQQFTTHAKQLYEYLSKTNVRGAGFRQVPYPIAIYGESGVGKSALSILLACDLLVELGHDPATAFHQMYARQSETEFWDGYHGQDIIIYDDAFQRNDDSSNPNTEVMELIRSVNVFPQHLHMACLEDKNTYLTAKSIIYSMNNINVQLKSIAHPDAFYRRLMENAWKVVPAPDFARIVTEDSGLERIYLDTDKISDKNVLNDKIYNLIRMERKPNGEFVEVGEPLTYESFIAQQITGMKDNFTKWTKVGMSLHERMLQRQQVRTETQQIRNMVEEYQNTPNSSDVVFTRSAERVKVSRMKAEVNSEEFFDCRDYTTYFSNLITEGIMQGKEMDVIEEEILMSAEADAYINWKLTIPSETWVQKWQRRAKTIYTDLKTSISNLWNRALQWFKEKREQYPTLFFFLELGSILCGFVAGFLALREVTDYFTNWNWDQYLDHDMTDDEIYEFCAKVCYAYDRGKITEDEFYDLCERLEWNIIGEYNPNKSQWSIFCEEHRNDERVFRVRKELASSGDKNTQRIARMRIELASSGARHDQRQQRLRVETGISSRFRAEQVRDVNAYEMMLQASKTSLYRLQLLVNGQRKDIGNVIALKGYNFLMPHHYLTYFRLQQYPLDTICTLNGCVNGRNTSDRVIEFKLSEIVTAYNEIGETISLNSAVSLRQLKTNIPIDGIIFTLSDKSKCHVHRDITKHFISQSELGKLKGKMLGMISTYAADGEVCTLMTKELRDVMMVDTEVEIDVDVPGKTEMFKECGGFQYSSHTVPGDCGGILVLRAVAIPHKFLGYHISGNLDGGFAIKLTQEMISQALEELEAKVGYRAKISFNAECNSFGCNPPEGAFVALGTVDIPLVQAVKTSIEPSPLHGKISQPITKPAMLRPMKVNGQLLDPLRKGLEKCGGVPLLLDEKDMQVVAQSVQRKYTHLYNEHVSMEHLCRVMTYEEAICGTDDPYICAINRTTSPGYPFNSDPQYRNAMAGKQYWMGRDEHFDFTSQNALFLRETVSKLLDDCRNGIIQNVICADTLKDERRPIYKVNEGKTRVFSACPMHYVIAFRQYFVGFAAWVMHNRIQNESAVGINPYIEWDKLYRQITKKGDSIIAGDFSNYDGSLNVQILWQIFHIVDDWYKGGEDEDTYQLNSVIRYGLWVHLVNSVHVFGNNLVMWTHSQPSGNPFTVILNTLYNSFVVRLAYLVVCDMCEQKKYRTMISFERYISMVAYGDDNLINISRLITAWFNQETISIAMEKLGHIYTEETKVGHSDKVRKVSEVAFLKRSFRYNSENTWDAALDKSVIYEMINWVRRGYVDIYDAIGQTIECALREMSLHSKDDFEHFAGQLYSCGVNKFMPIYTYEEYRIGLKYSDWETSLNGIGDNSFVIGCI